MNILYYQGYNLRWAKERMWSILAEAFGWWGRSEGVGGRGGDIRVEC